MVDCLVDTENKDMICIYMFLRRGEYLQYHIS